MLMSSFSIVFEAISYRLPRPDHSRLVAPTCSMPSILSAWLWTVFLCQTHVAVAMSSTNPGKSVNLSRKMTNLESGSLAMLLSSLSLAPLMPVTRPGPSSE